MDSFDFIVEIVNILLNLVIEYMFFASLWKKRFNFAITGVCFVVISILFLIVKICFKEMLASYISMFILTLLLAFLFDSKFLHKIIYTAILHSIMANIEMIVAMVITTAFSIDFNAGKEGVLYISGIILSKFVLFLTVMFIRLKKHTVLLEHYKKAYFGIFMFPFSSLIIILLQHKIFCDNPNQSVFVQYFVLFGYTILILANIVVFDFINTLYTNTLYENKLDMANELITNQAHQYQELIENNKNIMKIKHDHKNFCAGLITELKLGNVEVAINDLYKQQDIYFDDNTLTYKDTIQPIINMKRKIAGEDNISILFEHYNLDGISVPATDLAVLLGNALDNAIEACKLIDNNEAKDIKIFIALKNDNVFVKIKNPTCRDVDVKKLDSTKQTNISEHGFGLLSIKQIAKKYSGDVMFSSKNREFIITIMLKNP